MISRAEPGEELVEVYMQTYSVALEARDKHVQCRATRTGWQSLRSDGLPYPLK